MLERGRNQGGGWAMAVKQIFTPNVKHLHSIKGSILQIGIGEEDLFIFHCLIHDSCE